MLGVQHARHQGRGRLAQKPLDVRHTQQPAGRRLERRAAHVHDRGQRRGQLLVAHMGEGLGDGGVGRQDHRLGRHHAAGRLLAVHHQPAHLGGVLALHQLQQPLRRSRAGGRRSGRRRRRPTSPRGCQRRARSRGARGSRPGPRRAAPRGRRRGARRRARLPPRCGAAGSARGSRWQRPPLAGRPGTRPGARRPGRPGFPGDRRRRPTARRESGTCAGNPWRARPPPPGTTPSRACAPAPCRRRRPSPRRPSCGCSPGGRASGPRPGSRPTCARTVAC